MATDTGNGYNMVFEEEYNTDFSKEYNTDFEKEYYNYDEVTKRVADNKDRIKTLKAKAEAYIQTLQKDYTGYEIGLVETKFEEGIRKYNSFEMYIDCGYTIRHRTIQTTALKNA